MTVLHMKGARGAPKSVRSRMETMLLTPTTTSAWSHPPFQRPLKVNEKVRTIAEELKHNGGFINGVITLGSIDGDRNVYLMDGQHRMEAAKISELREFIADVRICQFDDLAEMGEEYIRLNSSIVRMNPDDIMRAMEGTLPAIHNIKVACPFVGYDQIRRGDKGPVLSMSAALRCWNISRLETPASSASSAMQLATDLTVDDADVLIKFLQVANSAWGNDPENYRLWGNLNLTFSMWLWRRLVVDKDRHGAKRYVVLTPDQFKKCLMSVSADKNYIDWLVGRRLGDHDRSPTYDRIKANFVTRLRSELPREKIVKLPQPSWSSHR